MIRDRNDQSHEELTTHIIYECNGKEVVIMMVMVEWGRRGHYNYSNGWFNSFFFCSFVQYETYIGVIPARRLIFNRIWFYICLIVTLHLVLYYRFIIWNVVIFQPENRISINLRYYKINKINGFEKTYDKSNNVLYGFLMSVTCPLICFQIKEPLLILPTWLPVIVMERLHFRSLL